MSTAKSLFSYSDMTWRNKLGEAMPKKITQVTPYKFKSYLMDQAEIFLESTPKMEWVPMYMVPENIKREVVEVLDQGTVMFRRNSGYEYFRVIENEDFSKFKLAPGMGTLKKEGFGI